MLLTRTGAVPVAASVAAKDGRPAMRKAAVSATARNGIDLWREFVESAAAAARLLLNHWSAATTQNKIAEDRKP
ncbi:hypothetical protein [Mesorhizobium prunaredense]|uniref:hypothetical protein n=1 Tax=Mesorhizobium prunaredense TaxID=1631249 RepID=UPI00142E5EFA|nr:hypothetical protein [Mesorhizobium prunaredense]